MLDADVVVRALRDQLVLDLDRREAGRLGHRDRAVHVHRVAEPRRAVEDQRELRHGADREPALCDVGDVEVRLEHRLFVAELPAAEIERLEAGRLGQAGHQWIEGKGREHPLFAGDQVTQRGSHRAPPP